MLKENVDAADEAGTVYVSITGLRLRNILHYPVFAFHAVRSMRQAQQAPGNLSAEARTVNGIHHTLTVWRDEKTMRAYLVAGAHLAAMKAFRSIATGKTFGFIASEPPDWRDVPHIWETKGRSV